MNNGKITYLLGAGASANAIPVLKNFPKAINDTIRVLEKWVNSREGEKYTDGLEEKENGSRGQVGHYKFRQAVGALRLLYDVSTNHTTVDTHCRMLKLTNSDPKAIKNALTLFFQLSVVRPRISILDLQLKDAYAPLDLRYDSFFASILEERWSNLPKQINVLSWNYDDQFEKAFSRYIKSAREDIDPEEGLRICTKFSGGGRDFPFNPDEFFIYKINGSATFRNSSGTIWKNRHNSFLATIPDVLEAFSLAEKAGSSIVNHVSFDWDTDDRCEGVWKGVLSALAKTETLVVVGYTFPFFNRKTDIEIFEHMPNLQEIVVQDINEKYAANTLDRIKQRIQVSGRIIRTAESEEFDFIPEPPSVFGSIVTDVGDFFIPNSFG